MSFFEPSSPPPPPSTDPPQPAWIGPAENVLGAGVGLAVVLARTGDIGIGLTGFVAEPNGVSFLVDFRRRFGSYAGTEWGRPFPPDHPGASQAQENFRLGIQLSDGRKTTTLDAFRDLDPGDPNRAPTPPRLIPRGGSGGGQHSYQQGYWLWPLPPSGALAFVCEWQAVGIPLTRVEVDAGPIIAAASRATVLWELPEPDADQRAGWTSY